MEYFIDMPPVEEQDYTFKYNYAVLRNILDKEAFDMLIKNKDNTTDYEIKEEVLYIHNIKATYDYLKVEKEKVVRISFGLNPEPTQFTGIKDVESWTWD